ncbi:hypothetical protein Dimus_008915, partial [Dionaea muscipula]
MVGIYSPDDSKLPPLLRRRHLFTPSSLHSSGGGGHRGVNQPTPRKLHAPPSTHIPTPNRMTSKAAERRDTSEGVAT